MKYAPASIKANIKYSNPQGIFFLTFNYSFTSPNEKDHPFINNHSSPLHSHVSKCAYGFPTFCAHLIRNYQFPFVCSSI